MKEEFLQDHTRANIVRLLTIALIGPTGEDELFISET